jgi:hypothetical protein
MTGLTFGQFAESLGVTLLPWQRQLLSEWSRDPEHVRAAFSAPPRKAASIPADPPLMRHHGAPTIDPSGLVISVDADCPHCGWPERTFDTRTRRFGCIRCTYESDERNA